MIQMVRYLLPFIPIFQITHSHTCQPVYALPLLSSFLDVTGQLMLVAAFSIARRVAGGTGGGVEELGEVGKDVVEKLSKL